MTHLLNAALTFDEESSRAFFAYAKKLGKSQQYDVLLGSRNLPHLTLVQFETAEDPHTWMKLADIVPHEVELSLAGLTLLPTKEGHVWVEVQVLKSETLLASQAALVAAVGRCEIHNGLGDAFRPHITLGRMKSTAKIKSFPLDGGVVRMKGLKGRVSVGWAGPNYEFVKPL